MNTSIPVPIPTSPPIPTSSPIPSSTVILTTLIKTIVPTQTSSPNKPILNEDDINIIKYVAIVVGTFISILALVSIITWLRSKMDRTDRTLTFNEQNL